MAATARPRARKETVEGSQNGFSADERLRDFAEAASEWFWEQDAELRFTYFSPNVEAVSGFPASDFIGKTRQATKPLGVAEAAWTQHTAMLADRKSFRDFRFARMDRTGRVRHFATSGKPIYDALGCFLGYRGVGRDITVEVEAEARAQAAETRLSDALANLSDGFVLFDKADRLVLWNEQIRKLNPAVGEHLIGKTFRETFSTALEAGALVVPAGFADGEQWLDHIIALRSGGAADYEIERTDGRWFALRDRRTSDGGMVGIRVDITETKRREAALITGEARAVAAEQRLRDAIEALSDGFILFDRDDRIVVYNEAMIRQVPPMADVDRVVGMTFDELTRFVVSSRYYEGAYRSPAEIDAWIETLKARRRSGAEIVETTKIEGRTYLYRARRTREGGFVGIRTDVTEAKQREEALADREARAIAAENRLRAAIESMSDGFVLRDRNDRVILCNRRHLEIFGYASIDAVLGKTSDELINDLFDRGVIVGDDGARPDDQARRAWFASRKDRRRAASYSREQRVADGRTLLIRSESTSDGGNVQITSDVSAERLREARLRNAEEILRDAIESMNVGVMLRDAAGIAQLCNSRYLEILGFRTFDEIRLLSGLEIRRLLQQRGFFSESVPADEVDIWLARREETLHRGTGQIEYPTSDGRVLNFRIHGTPSGGSVNVIADVTVDRERERRAAEAEARLRTAIETIDDGFSLWDRADRLVLWNKRLETLFQSTATAFSEGLSFNDWVLADARSGAIRLGDQTPEAYAADRAAQHLKGGSREIPFANGRVLLVRERELPGGGIVRIDTDITERKRGEEQLRGAKDAAEAASRAKSTFLASMSHELRTPLNAILGFSESMAGEMLGPLGKPRYVEYARDINKSGMLLLDLINDILDMSRIEAGRFDLHRELVVVPELVEEVRGVIGVQAEKAGVRIDVATDRSLPAISLDHRAIRQVLLNLLSNAVKFSPAGSAIALSAGLSGGFLRFRVADRGVGISKADIKRLGRPFERVGDVWTQPIQGTGLGLSISKSLVQMHGGRIEIESELGQGTIVTVLLPFG